MQSENTSTKRAYQAEQHRNRTARFVILIVVLAFSTTMGLLHQFLPYGMAPVGVDALCPFGAIESVFTLIATGKMIQRIALSSFLLLAATLVVAALYRRAFCGYLCPLGTLQELFSRLGRRLFRRAYRLPALADLAARGLKYVVLLVVVIGSARTAELIIRPYDPWAAYHHLSSSEIWTEFSWGVSILGFSLLGAVFLNRVFCKYLCPMGAFLGLLSPLSVTRVQRDPGTCIHCHRCDRICPVDLDVSQQTAVSSPECLNCQECVNVCPVPETLLVRTRGQRPVAAGTVLLAVSLIFLSIVGVSSLLALFQWQTVPIPTQLAQAGAFDPASVRGKMVFAEVIAASGVPEEVFMRQFRLTPEDLRYPIKDAGAKYGFEAEHVRDFIEDYLAGRTTAPEQPPEVTAEAENAKPQIVGTMTLEEVASASGVPLEALLADFPVAEADRNVPLKNLKQRYSFDTQAVRDSVQRYREEHPSAASSGE